MCIVFYTIVAGQTMSLKLHNHMYKCVHLNHNPPTELVLNSKDQLYTLCDNLRQKNYVFSFHGDIKVSHIANAFSLKSYVSMQYAYILRLYVTGPAKTGHISAQIHVQKRVHFLVSGKLL